MKSAEWIWLPGARAPELQHTKHTVFDSREVPFAVVQFKKKFAFASPISRATLHISGDCRFRLIVNGNYIGMGPPFREETGLALNQCRSVIMIHIRLIISESRFCSLQRCNSAQLCCATFLTAAEDSSWKGIFS